MSTTTIRISPNNFAKGVRNAKVYGGKFDGATKTWAIPSNRPELGAPAAYGWIIVAAPTAPIVDRGENAECFADSYDREWR